MKEFKRGEFYFYLNDNIVRVYLGKPNVPSEESELVLEIDQFWLPELIAGLIAFKPVKRKVI